MRDSHLRTLVKTISWRIIATGTTITISYIITGKLTAALSIGGLEFFTKMLFYYVHERAWSTIPFGKAKRQSVEKK